MKRELRDVRAEAVHWRKQAESTQASLTAALNKMYELTARQRAGAKPLDAQTVPLLVHQSNQAIAQMLSLPFAGPSVAENLAPDIPDDAQPAHDPANNNSNDQAKGSSLTPAAHSLPIDVAVTPLSTPPATPLA